MDYIVVFYPEGKVLEVPEGTTLLEAARQAGVWLDSACGGEGSCGKCKVIVRLGSPHGEASPPAGGLTPQERAEGYVRACQSRVQGDLVVEVPTSSQLGEVKVLSGDIEAEVEKAFPLVDKVCVQLPDARQTPGQSDLERLQAQVLEQRPDLEALSADLEAVRDLPAAARAQGGHVCAALADMEANGRGFSRSRACAGSGEPAPGAARIIAVEPGSRAPVCYGVAVDVGTTTIAAHLMDLQAGQAVSVRGCLNEQIAYGADVISRMVWVEENTDGPGRMQQAVVSTINRLIGQLVVEQGITTEDIYGVACAGNTVMTHFLLGLETAHIRRDPYVPAARAFPIARARDLGLAANPRAPVYCLPCISSYVGGDIAAGVLSTGLADVDQTWMLVDMGTNGEMVIGNREWMVCCSCSAGPAFEGSGIAYGMHASLGAIERAHYDPTADAFSYATIGRVKPRGICGSGLIDALATLLRAGVIDRAGKINLGFASPRVRVRGDQPEFVLVWGHEVGREDDISLCEADIRNLVRAKAAVFAGIAVLLKNLNMAAEALDRILVAGAFGNYLDAENAVTLGLLPDLPLEKIRFVGNSSVAGARMALLSREARRKAELIARAMTNFELSAVSAFMEHYVAGLFLPHTDLSLFPSVASKLRARVS